MVEVNGQLFPAGNIQVWECSPALHFSMDHNTFYGIYFEILFENGCTLIVFQEACAVRNRETESICEDYELDHYLVEVKHASDGYKEVNFAYHTEGEQELAEVLEGEKQRNKGAA